MFSFRAETPKIIKLLSAVIIVGSYNFDAFMYGYCNKNYRRDIKRYLHGRVPWLVKVKPLDSDTIPDTITGKNAMFTNAFSCNASKSDVKQLPTRGMAPNSGIKAPDKVIQVLEEGQTISSDYSSTIVVPTQVEKNAR